MPLSRVAERRNLDGGVKMTGSTVIPCLRYRDAKRMIGWLCDAFGFRAQAVKTGAMASRTPN